MKNSTETNGQPSEPSKTEEASYWEKYYLGLGILLIIAVCIIMLEAIPPTVQLTYVYRPNCGWCAKMDVVLKEMKQELGSQLTITRVDETKDKFTIQRLEREFGYKGYVPFFVIQNDFAHEGAVPKNYLMKKVCEYIKEPPALCANYTQYEYTEIQVIRND